jgi:hypothetical protein
MSQFYLDCDYLAYPLNFSDGYLRQDINGYCAGPIERADGALRPRALAEAGYVLVRLGSIVLVEGHGILRWYVPCAPGECDDIERVWQYDLHAMRRCEHE